MTVPPLTGPWPASRNHLLATLPALERARLAPRLLRIPFKTKQVLYRQGQPIDRLYFPDSGVISLVSTMDDGKSVEVGVVGNEGAIGIHALYGSATMPCEALAHMPGEADSLTVTDLRWDSRNGGPLTVLLGRYSQSLLIQAMQTAACNRLHSIRQRAARWILTVHDRVQADRFPLTQELLATMLGARRPTVTILALSLQRAGLIEYRHGRMVICDRPRLEAASCECYRLVEEHVAQILTAS